MRLPIYIPAVGHFLAVYTTYLTLSAIKPDSARINLILLSGLLSPDTDALNF
jgi:hypothetical protein